MIKGSKQRDPLRDAIFDSMRASELGNHRFLDASAAQRSQRSRNLQYRDLYDYQPRDYGYNEYAQDQRMQGNPSN